MKYLLMDTKKSIYLVAQHAFLNLTQHHEAANERQNAYSVTKTPTPERMIWVPKAPRFLTEGDQMISISIPGPSAVQRTLKKPQK